MNSKNSPKLLFVYNAESGLMNDMLDLIQKNFFPSTYTCNLCRLTYNTIGMRSEWKRFIKTLNLEVEFFHKDEFIRTYFQESILLPAAYMIQDSKISLFLSRSEINSVTTLDELIKLVRAKIWW